jgi:hypothetical protein
MLLSEAYQYQIAVASVNGMVVAGERHGMCESVFKMAGKLHGVCELALSVLEFQGHHGNITLIAAILFLEATRNHKGQISRVTGGGG